MTRIGTTGKEYNEKANGKLTTRRTPPRVIKNRNHMDQTIDKTISNLQEFNGSISTPWRPSISKAAFEFNRRQERHQERPDEKLAGAKTILIASAERLIPLGGTPTRSKPNTPP
jgi:hypothetical protein